MPYTAAACPGCRRRMVGVGLSASFRARASAAELGPTPFVKCRAEGCSYFVAAGEERCPDCGVERPTGDAGSTLFSAAPKPAFAFIFLAVFALQIILLTQLPAESFLTNAFAALLISWFATAGAFIVWALWKLARASGRSRSEESQPFALRRGEQAIVGRLVEIKKRQQQLEAVLERAGREESGRAAELRAPLEAAREALGRQHARYSLKLLEIEAARWQNKFAPLIHHLDSLTFEQSENRLKAVEAARKEGLVLRARAERLRASAAEAEAARFAAALDETLASCEKMQDALLDRQAVLALKGVTPLDDALHEHEAARRASDSADVFNLQVSMTDFSSSLEELEDEYRRMRDEAVAGERMRQVLGG